jgi:hypothetical protein
MKQNESNFPNTEDNSDHFSQQSNTSPIVFHRAEDDRIEGNYCTTEVIEQSNEKLDYLEE